MKESCKNGHHYVDNQGLCHYCGKLLEPTWWEQYAGEPHPDDRRNLEMINGRQNSIPRLKLKGVDNRRILERVKVTVSCLQSEHPRRFITSHMVARDYVAYYSDEEVPMWYIRKFLCQPDFVLDDRRGWKLNQREILSFKDNMYK